MAAGDTMLARTIGERLLGDPAAPFAGVASTFAKADLVLLNLECTISTRGTPDKKAFTFRAPPAAAKALADAGVDLVTVANNHGMDYGPDALADTISLLKKQGITTIGAGADSTEARAPRIVERNGLRIAFLAYLGFLHDASGWSGYPWEAGPSKPGLAITRKKQIAQDVASAKKQADVVVVFFHAGDSLDTTPSDFQRSITKVALNAGAALVLSTSPHVLQGTRRKGATFVAWSLGNFVFDESRGISNDSVILDVTLDASGVKSVRFVPIIIRNGFPVRARGADAARINRELGPA